MLTTAKLKTLGRALQSPSGPEAFALAIAAFRTIFRRAYPFHWPELDWIDDTEFWRLMKRFGEEEGFNAHRRKALFEFARMATGRVSGDTAECGVFKGLGSYLICKALVENGLNGRCHFIFDSFEGLSEPGASDGAYWSKGNLACDEQEVRANLREFEFVAYMKGWIPERFAEVADRRFSMVHIDVDLAEPTRQSLEFFHPRLTPNGVMIVDDYGFATCAGATAVVEQFIKNNADVSLVRSPVGGGILMKH